MRRRTARAAIFTLRKLVLTCCAAMVVCGSLTQKWKPRAAVSVPPGVKRTFVPKGGKVTPGPDSEINPKLKRLVETEEYRSFIDMLARLEEEDALQEFFDNADAYFDRNDIFKMAEASMAGKTRENVAKVRGEWSQIWPRSLSNIGVDAFERTLVFWNLLGQSKLADIVFQDIRSSAGRLESMEDAQYLEEVGRLLSTSKLVKQYQTLSSKDAEVQAVSPATGAFITGIVAKFQKRLAGKAVEPGGFATEIVIASCVAAIVGIFMFVTGSSFPSLPFSDDAPPPPPDQPIQRRYVDELLEQQLKAARGGSEPASLEQ